MTTKDAVLLPGVFNGDRRDTKTDKRSHQKPQRQVSPQHSHLSNSAHTGLKASRHYIQVHLEPRHSPNTRSMDTDPIDNDVGRGTSSRGLNRKSILFTQTPRRVLHNDNDSTTSSSSGPLATRGWGRTRRLTCSSPAYLRTPKLETLPNLPPSNCPPSGGL